MGHPPVVVAVALCSGAAGFALALLGSKLLRRAPKKPQETPAEQATSPGSGEVDKNPTGQERSPAWQATSPGSGEVDKNPTGQERSPAWQATSAGSGEVGRNPAWKAPENQPPPFPLHPVISFDPSSVDPSVLYPLVISSVVPRPIALISTLSKSGVRNLSPYSYFNAVSHNPPVLAIGHCWSRGRPKDALQNILDTGEMVVCIISKWFVESANHTCGPYPPDVDEMALSGLSPIASEKVGPPRVAESAVNMESRLLHHYDLKDKDGNITTTVVLAEVVLLHIAEAVTTKTQISGKIIVDPEKLQPVCRLGGTTFGVEPKLFDIPRPNKDGQYT